MILQKAVLTGLLILLSLSLSFAQKKFKFGKVEKDDLEMAVYPQDSSASAVILCDIGVFRGSTLSFSRHVRVKILKKSGLEWGNWVFNTPSKGSFRVKVFNLVDGEVVDEKVSRSDIYEEEIFNDNTQYKVFAPGVKEGTVIDIEYNHVGLPFEWRFQERIPVAYSYLRLESSPYVQYDKSHYGFQPIKTVGNNEWEAVDMPAFKIEPYLNSYSNYITKFEFQLKTLGAPGPNFIAYSTNWRQIAYNLTQFDDFGGVLENSAFLNSFADSVKVLDIELEDKIELAYDYIQENIKWNEEKTLYASDDFRGNFKKNHSGNSADINLLLVSLLKKMDIRSFPVALSTKENGMIIPYSPSINKLNYVVAYVNQDSVDMLMDATSKHLRPGILPLYCLNGNGLVVHEDFTGWVNLAKGHIDFKSQYITIDINENLEASGTVVQQNGDYAFVKWAEKMDKINKDPELVINSLTKKFSDFAIENYEITDENAEELKANEKFKVDLSEHVIDVGTGVVFSPIIFYNYTENPFKSIDRKFPVDMECPRHYNTTVVVNLPEGYDIKQLPEPMRLQTTDGSANFLYVGNKVGQMLQFQIRFETKKQIYSEKEYQELRNFFSIMLKKVNEPVELIAI